MKYPEISNVAKETICVLNYFDNSFISKIPINFLNEMKNLAKESNLIVKIDKNKKLEEQDLLEETKDMLSLIYYSYIATKEEKDEIKSIWNNNELLYQEELKEKYNVDNMFKENGKEQENKLIIIEDKKGILQDIKNFFKSIFRKN